MCPLVVPTGFCCPVWARSIHGSSWELPTSVPINALKMGALLEMGRLMREEEGMGVRKRK